MRASFLLLEDAEDDDGLVVEVCGACLKIGDGLKDGVDGGTGGGMALGFEESGEAFVTKHLACAVDGVDDAVGEEDDEVAGAGGQSELFIFGVGEHAEGEAFGFDGDGLTAAAEDRLHGAGVGDLQCLVLIIPEGKKHDDVL